MEMIDVLQKLKEIAESKPELVKDAVENVERTNPKAVTEGGMKDYLHDEAEKLSREEFIKKHGESLAGFWDSINGTEESAVKEAAGISSQQIEAFKKWHEKYSKMKSRDVFNYAEGIFRAYMETGIPELDGASRQDPEGKAYDELNAIFPSMKAEVEEIGNALKANGIDPYSGEKFSEGNEDAIKEGHYPHIKSFGKLYGINDKQQYTDMADDAQSMDMGEFIDTYDNTIDMAGDFWEDHQKVAEHNEDAIKEDPMTLAKELASEIMKYVRRGLDHIPADPLKAKAQAYLRSIKETVKEAIQISTDTPQEASMMMQILALAGVKPVDASMIGAEEPAADQGTDGDEMAKFRNMVTAPDEEKAQETFANEPEEKVADIDTLVNVHSGGLNRRKQQFAKAQDGDNAMAVAQEDKITEQELANSLRAQYESFKSAYQTEAKKAKPDFLDMDKDGNKKEPMKKAIKDKEAK